ncbi:hypothetical protein [Terriglobus tenax]|uniref:hypothetical protein n=1 Tax=Terriglobus tenax TaxID=1111115 RepID=UPI0021DFA80E|nr:hypothetical protein [Terriglobus tenax]
MEIAASSAEAVDNVIRQAGWHFVWLTDSGSRVAFGLSKEAACRNAAVLVLSQIGERFNTAELGRVSVTKYPGFYVAKVVLHTRQIQRHASLGLVDEMLLREVMA